MVSNPRAWAPKSCVNYQVHLQQKRKLAPDTVEGRISALRFLYRKVLQRRDLTFDYLAFTKKVAGERLFARENLDTGFVGRLPNRGTHCLTSSTRRLLARPSSVSLEAIGAVGPSPKDCIRLAVTL